MMILLTATDSRLNYTRLGSDTRHGQSTRTGLNTSLQLTVFVRVSPTLMPLCTIALPIGESASGKLNVRTQAHKAGGYGPQAVQVSMR